MPKTIQLHIVVTRLVRNNDHSISGLCNRPCSIKAALPTPIMRNVGSAIPSVLRVRIVSMACGK